LIFKKDGKLSPEDIQKLLKAYQGQSVGSRSSLPEVVADALNIQTMNWPEVCSKTGISLQELGVKVPLLFRKPFLSG